MYSINFLIEMLLLYVTTLLTATFIEEMTAADESSSEQLQPRHFTTRNWFQAKKSPPYYQHRRPHLHVDIEQPDPSKVLIHPALKVLFNRTQPGLAYSISSENTTPNMEKDINQKANPLETQSIVDAMAPLK